MWTSFLGGFLALVTKSALNPTRSRLVSSGGNYCWRSARLLRPLLLWVFLGLLLRKPRTSSGFLRSGSLDTFLSKGCKHIHRFTTLWFTSKTFQLGDQVFPANKEVSKKLEARKVIWSSSGRRGSICERYESLLANTVVASVVEDRSTTDVKNDKACLQADMHGTRVSLFWLASLIWQRDWVV